MATTDDDFPTLHCLPQKNSRPKLLAGVIVELLCSRHHLPCYVDAKRCVGLFSTSLVDAARSLHHLFNWLVVAEFELMNHLLTVLNNPNLTTETQREEPGTAIMSDSPDLVSVWTRSVYVLYVCT